MLRQLSSALVTFTLMAFVTLGSSAQDARPVATLKLKDGTRVQGHATAYDGTTQTLSFVTLDDQELSLKIDQLDGRSAYLVNNKNVSKDDGPGQLMVANFARDAGLFVHSARHYGYATKADPTLADEVAKQKALMHQRAASYCMAQATAAVDKGDIKSAEKWLTTLVTKLPDEPLAAQAKVQLDDYYSEVRDAREAQLKADAGDLLTKDLKRGKQYYDDMLAKNKRALTKSSGSASLRDWQSALKAGEKAIKEIDRVAKKNTDAATQATLEGYRTLINNQMIEIRLNTASNYMTRSSYEKALSEVNQALAIDSKNAAALSMRSRVQTAAASRSGWLGAGVLVGGIGMR